MIGERKEGTRDLLQSKIGDEYAAIEVTITQEEVDTHAWANDDYNPWYMEDSPFGGRIVPPTRLHLYYLCSLWGHYAHPQGGVVHTKEEHEFINPLKVGKKVKISGKMVERYSRKGREFFVSEYFAVDEDGLEISRWRTTDANPIVVSSKE